MILNRLRSPVCAGTARHAVPPAPALRRLAPKLLCLQALPMGKSTVPLVERGWTAARSAPGGAIDLAGGIGIALGQRYENNGITYG
jgi:hypothetical protein